MSHKSENNTDMDSAINQDVLDGYSNFDIGIVPVIKPVSGFESPTDSGDADGFNPPPIQSQTGNGFQDDMYGAGLGAEVTTLEDCQSLSNMAWNLPGMFLGEHLERSEEQTDKFAKELYKYCIKKGIDPSDYVFDEFGLVTATLILGMGMYRDHKEFKRDKRDGETFNKPQGRGSSARTVDSGLGVSDSGSDEPMTPIELKTNDNPASSSGGDNIETED